MKPVGLLMQEHRLIERLIAAVAAEKQRIERGNQADPAFIQSAIDCFRTYADRTHHGKEEDILFKEMVKKGLKLAHQKVMDELLGEHNLARATVTALIEANAKYAAGEIGQKKPIVEILGKLAILYPKHIAKEERGLFEPSYDYFTEAEQTRMLRLFYEFDRKMIHEKYEKVVTGLER